MTASVYEIGGLSITLHFVLLQVSCIKALYVRTYELNHIDRGHHVHIHTYLRMYVISPQCYSNPVCGWGMGMRPSDGMGMRPSDVTGMRPSDGMGMKPSDDMGMRPSDGMGMRPSDGTGMRSSEDMYNYINSAFSFCTYYIPYVRTYMYVAFLNEELLSNKIIVLHKTMHKLKIR